MSEHNTFTPCELSGERPSELHHLKSRAAFGRNKELYDQVWNIIPLTRDLHMEVHRIGRSSMAKKYFPFHNFLVTNNWELDPSGKWYHV